MANRLLLVFENQDTVVVTCEIDFCSYWPDINWNYVCCFATSNLAQGIHFAGHYAMRNKKMLRIVGIRG